MNIDGLPFIPTLVTCPGVVHTFGNGLPELGDIMRCFALLFHCLHHLIEESLLLRSPWTCVIVSH